MARAARVSQRERGISTMSSIVLQSNKYKQELALLSQDLAGLTDSLHTDHVRDGWGISAGAPALEQPWPKPWAHMGHDINKDIDLWFLSGASLFTPTGKTQTHGHEGEPGTKCTWPARDKPKPRVSGQAKFSAPLSSSHQTLWWTKANVREDQKHQPAFLAEQGRVGQTNILKI